MSKEEINTYFDNYETFVIDFDPKKWKIAKNDDGEIILKKFNEDTGITNKIKPIVNLDDAMKDSIDDINEDMDMIRRIRKSEGIHD